MTTLLKIMITVSLVAVARADPTLSSSESWGYGLLTGFGLSLLGFVAALILICLQKCLSEGCFKIFVNQLYALACGAIIGDAMIHILPDAFKSQTTNEKYVSLIFVCAILFFIILERLFKSLGIAHQHWGEDSSHHHEHDHTNEEPTNEKSQQASLQNGLLDKQKKFSRNEEGTSGSVKKTCLENLKGKGTAGYLNLLSSFVHNFFDGFGIGVGFASGDMAVITPIVIAIIAHEIPREMGDVGILIKNGFSNIQTVLCNGFINFMSLFGVIAGLGLGSISDQAQNYVLVFVAGNFIYIGADIWKHLLANKSLILNIAEVLMFSLGVGAMFLVLLAEG